MRVCVREWEKTPEHKKERKVRAGGPVSQGRPGGEGAEASRRPCRPCTRWAWPRGRGEVRLRQSSGAAHRGAGSSTQGARGSQIQRKARCGREKKVTKKLVCHHAKWRHLNISGGGGPGQRAEGCPGSARWPELGAWGDSAGERDPETPSVSGPTLRRLGRTLPSLSSPRQQTPATDPCLQTQPGGGVGRPECALAGWGRPLAPEDATSSEERRVGARERARQLERTERLVFETVNSLNPYCEGFMQNISGLLK